MKLRHALLGAAFALALPASALAQSAEGFYVGAQTGASWLQDTDFRGPVKNVATSDVTWTGIAEGGYKLGNGFRLGLEFGYVEHNIDDITGGAAGRAGGEGDINAWSFMSVAAYEFDTGAGLKPFVGVGVGILRAEIDQVGDLFAAGNRVSDKDSALGYQFNAGVGYEVAPNLDLTVGYRFLGSDDLDIRPAPGTRFETEYQSHSVLVGLRYTFGAPAAAPAPTPVAATPTPPPAPPAPPPAPPAISRNFTVFFDFDKSDLTADARQVLDNVVKDARTGSIANVQVTGHADRSGSDDYNQRLSLRRAEAVREYLVTQGLGTGQVAVNGRGESEPLVPTADGVREPSNRRAVIIFP